MNALSEFFSGELTLTNTDALHFRIYLWWYMHTNRVYDKYKRKDFCFYCRIILIWSPLMWFFKVPLFSWVRPWMITLIASVTGYTGIALWLWPEQTWYALKLIGIAVFVVVVIVAIALGIAYLIEEQGKTLSPILKWLTSPIWFPFYLLMLALVWLDQKGFYRWYIRAGVWYVIRPITVTIAILIGLGYWFLGVSVMTQIIFAIGVILGLAVVAVALILGLLWLFEQLQRRFRTRRVIEQRARPQGSGTAKVLWELMKAKKRKICPLLNLPNIPEVM